MTITLDHDSKNLLEKIVENTKRGSAEEEETDELLEKIAHRLEEIQVITLESTQKLIDNSQKLLDNSQKLIDNSQLLLDKVEQIRVLIDEPVKLSVDFQTPQETK